MSKQEWVMVPREPTREMMIAAFDVPLSENDWLAKRYRAMLAAAPSQPAPQSTRDRLQQRCSDWGVYWRASDAHGVDLSHEQAVELLQDALGVEVEIAPQPLPDAPAKHLRLDVSKEWCERMGKIEQDAGHPDVSVGPSAQPLPGAAQPTYPACKGTNCGATDGWSHSPECVAEHDAACLGAQPAEAQALGAAAQLLGNLLTKIPSLDPAWPDEVRDGWMRCFEALRRLTNDPSAQPVREAEPAPKREPPSEVEVLRVQQAADVMPRIGPMLDAWDGLNNDDKRALWKLAPDICKAVRSIACAMDGTERAATGEKGA